MYDRRLQILLDADRYERLARRADEQNISVAAAIRDAIDLAYPADAGRRRQAAALILTAAPMPVPGPEELKTELDELRTGRL
jgi:hypothetical protein